MIVSCLYHQIASTQNDGNKDEYQNGPSSSKDVGDGVDMEIDSVKNGCDQLSMSEKKADYVVDIQQKNDDANNDCILEEEGVARLKALEAAKKVDDGIQNMCDAGMLKLFVKISSHILFLFCL